MPVGQTLGTFDPTPISGTDLAPPKQDPGSAAYFTRLADNLASATKQLGAGSSIVGSTAYSLAQNLGDSVKYENQELHNGNPFNINDTLRRVNDGFEYEIDTKFMPAFNSETGGLEAMRTLAQQALAIYDPQTSSSATSTNSGTQFGVQSFGGAPLVPGYDASVAQTVSTDVQSAMAATSASDKLGHLQDALTTMSNALGSGAVAASGTTLPTDAGSAGATLSATLPPAAAQKIATALKELASVASMANNTKALDDIAVQTRNLNTAIQNPSGTSTSAFAQQVAAGLQQILAELSTAMNSASTVDPTTANEALDAVGTALASLNSALANAGDATASPGADDIVADVQQLRDAIGNYGSGSPQVQTAMLTLENDASRQSGTAPASAVG